MSRLLARALVLGVTFGLFSTFANAQPAPSGKRVAIFISDTHFGLGRTADGKWHPYEDARWHNAFNGFLASLDGYQDDVDLVILGDLMELWQPAPEMPCSAPKPDLGCTKAQMLDLVEYVLGQHKDELKSLSQFANKRGNRVHIVPGNHDAALLIPEVWSEFRESLDAAAQPKVLLVGSGVWVSADGKIIGEHGHQIGMDVNGYKSWPGGITTVDGGVTHMTRTWGENFVQTLFNKQESQIEFIDNLSPESTGMKYKLKVQGPLVVAEDLARVIRFNLFETSDYQRSRSLSAGGKFSWNDAKAREAGHLLYLAALPANDPFRDEINARSDLRLQLDEDLGSEAIVSSSEVQSLCAHALINGDDKVCGSGTLSAGAQGIIYTKQQVLAKHIGMRRAAYPSASTFVYGHTHQVEPPRSVKASDGKGVWVSNTGAFQRVVNEKQFEGILAASRASTPPARITLESLPACYSYIEVMQGVSKLWWWVQDEDQAQGRRVSSGDKACWAE